MVRAGFLRGMGLGQVTEGLTLDRGRCFLGGSVEDTRDDSAI